MEIYIVLIIIVAIILSNKIFQFNSVFILKIKGKNLDIKKGKLPDRFMHEAKTISIEKRIVGEIKGIKTEHGIKLSFSNSINELNQQRFRNVFPYELYDSKKTNHQTPPNKRVKK
jgi:hypothetical protein